MNTNGNDAKSLEHPAYVRDMHGGLYILRQYYLFIYLFLPPTYYVSLVSTSYRWSGWVWEIIGEVWDSKRKNKLVTYEPNVFENYQLRFRILRKNIFYKWIGWVSEITGWNSWLWKITNNFSRNSKDSEEKIVGCVAVLHGSTFASWTKAFFIPGCIFRSMTNWACS